MNDKQYNQLMTSLDRVESQLDSMLNSIKMLKEIKYEIIKKRQEVKKDIAVKSLSKEMINEYKMLKNKLDEKLVQWTDGKKPNGRNEYYTAKENLFYFKSEKHRQGYDI